MPHSISNLPMLIDGVTIEPTNLTHQNKENVDRLYQYLQALIGDIEANSNEVDGNAVVVVPTVTSNGVKKTTDQSLFTIGDVSSMVFNVVAGHYYTIKFLVVARGDVGDGVGFDITHPLSTIFVAQGVV